MKPLLLLAMLLVATLPTFGSVLSDAADALGPKEWVYVPANWEADMTGNGNVFTWSDSAMWDPVNGHIVWVNAAVGTNFYQEYRYDVATNLWTLTELTAPGSSSGHAYDCNGADPETGELYWQRGGNEFESMQWGLWNGTSYDWVDGLDLPYDVSTAVSMTWVKFMNSEDGGIVHVGSHGVAYSLNRHRDTWTIIPDPDSQGETNWQGQHQFSQYSEVKRVLWVGGGNGNTTHSLVLDSALNWTAMDASPCNIEKPPDSDRSVDPVTGNFLLLCPGSPFDLYELDPDTGSYTLITGMTNEPDPFVNNGIAQVPLPEYGVVAFILGWPEDNHDNGIWLYKHADYTCTNTTYDVYADGSGDGNFFDVVCGTGSLGCGDVVNVHSTQGTFEWSSKCNIASNGTEENPIVIRGAAGEARPILRFDGSGQNSLNIKGRHIEIRDLHIKGGADAIRIEDNGTDNIMSQYITIDGNIISNCNVGISANSDDTNHITITENEIHTTGVASTGEGLYIGCNNDACRSIDIYIARNYIHDTDGGSQGDGIELKFGSSGTIEDNVIHTTGFPGIFTYGSNGRTGVKTAIRRNAVWSTDDSALQIIRDAIVENNVFIGDSNSIAVNIQNHAQVGDPQDIIFQHNVIYDATTSGTECIRIDNIPGSGSNFTFKGNAVYCNEADPYAIAGWGDAALDDNVINPFVAADWPAGSYILGNAENTDLISVSTRDFYPKVGSALIDACADFGVALDYNLTSRTSVHDCGAYNVTTPTNPVGPIAAGFKNMPASVDGSRLSGGTLTSGSIGP